MLLINKGGEDVLTAKQEKFVMNIIDGMSQADAYRSAYDSKKMSDNAIYREASLLMSRPKIAQRVKELRDQMAEDDIMTAKERLRWLSQIIKSEEETTADKLKASDQMNKMQGEYVQKVVADIDTTYTINIELEDDDEEVS